MSAYVLTYDVGTSGVKTCLYHLSPSLSLVASALHGYELTILENGGAEQDPADWWQAMRATTSQVLKDSGIPASHISGISFCAQMQGLVLVDEQGAPVRKAMSYMDTRASEEHRRGIRHGLQFAGANVFKLLKSLAITRAVPASVKDPVWKYRWVRRHEPEAFSRVHKWLDVKEYLLFKCTGEFVMTEDTAYATLLYDAGNNRFSKEMCRMFGVRTEHFPKVISSTAMAGLLTAEAAAELGLKEDTPVFGGGGDASLIGVGAGAVAEGDTHIYLGTSGWVSTVVNRQIIDAGSMIASIVGARPKHYHYFCELETAGKCLEWVKNHLALDEIGIYLEKKQVSESQETMYRSLYDYMMHAIKDVPAGSNGVIFTPWLHGNRCPFEDAHARGLFFNISIETGKTELIHAVLEGICYHLRWQLEAQDRKIKTSQAIRFVGGGALAPLTCQILADILGRTIETVDSPQNAGAVGAAITAAVGLGIVPNLDAARSFVQVRASYTPNPRNKAVYDTYFGVFKSLYRRNKKAFGILNNLKSNADVFQAPL
ncbi:MULTISPECIES: FGGY-family carbohydrate kinase [unclassified Paenibacillus]|uniref:xylulokinase n=1 Tax=unclassified Paenibacillus TaxID=185978 RepID=UPI0010446388|nr:MULTISPECIES: FGGY-family carbohydrate kinase [unclassified Paenibacillus]NIK67180.1 xylulokinase [Paenibacillus sp. BK720]TCN01224.1 xylulokinase [Paenibacillus sp. BK033]